MKRLNTVLRKVTADNKTRGMDIYTSWPDKPKVTSLVFRVGSQLFTREVDNLDISPATRSSVVKLPGNDVVARY